MVSEYMNMLEVAAILVFPIARGCHKCWADQAQGLSIERVHGSGVQD